jgi:hypothetical protein
LQTGSLQASVESMLFSRYSEAVFTVRPNMNWLGINAALSSLNFLHVGLFFGVFGWAQMRKIIGRSIAWPLFLLLCLHALFFLCFSVPDQFTFILPSLVLFSLGIAVGIGALAKKSAGWRRLVVSACLLSIFLMPVIYSSVPLVLKMVSVNVARARSLPFRDEVRYWTVPWKHNEHSAEQFARTALLEAAPDGLIVCDSTSYYPLFLMRERIPGVEGVSIEGYAEMASRYGAVPDELVQLLSARQVFLVSPVLNFIAEEHRQFFEFAREDGMILYTITKKSLGSLE